MSPAVLGFCAVIDLGCSENALVAFQLEQQQLPGAAETDNGTSSQLMPCIPSAAAAELQVAITLVAAVVPTKGSEDYFKPIFSE